MSYCVVGERTQYSSADLASAYEKAKEDLDKATDASTSNYAKKRSMASEVKHFREQRDEVKQWERLNREKVQSLMAILIAGYCYATSFLVEVISSHY